MRAVTEHPVNATNPVKFSVIRVPFFLEPEYPKDETWSETNRVRLERKWGGKAAFAAQKHQHRLKERGQEIGIEHFNLDRQASNTLRSHRLVQWVTKNYGCAKSEAIYDRLNKLHFVEGKKLNDSKMLLDEVKALGGMDVERATTFLASNEGEAEISEATRNLHRLGVHSIPQFIIGGAEIFSGAVHHSELERAFRKIELTGLGAPGAAFSEILGISEEVVRMPLEFKRLTA